MFSYSSQFFLFMEIIYGHITIYLDRNVCPISQMLLI